MFAEDVTKWAAKGRDRERAAKKKARRLAAMTPEERVDHEAWQAAHRPGPPGLRAAARERRRQNRDLRDMFARADEPSPSNLEAAELADQAAALRARIAELEAGAARPLNAFD